MGIAWAGWHILCPYSVPREHLPTLPAANAHEAFGCGSPVFPMDAQKVGHLRTEIGLRDTWPLQEDRGKAVSRLDRSLVDRAFSAPVVKPNR